MSVQIGNPYAPIASIYTDGLDTIIGALPSKPTVDDLASAVNDVVSSVFYGGTPTVIVGIEIQTMINAAISNYVKGDSLSSRYLSPISFNDITVDAISDRIENLESNILDSKLSPEGQKPLLISTLIGSSTYSYFATIIATPPSPNPWGDYFDAALVSPIDNLPYWVTASMQSSFIGASSPGLLQPSSEQAGSEIISALASAWVVTVGKVIFLWIPEIKEPKVDNDHDCGCKDALNLSSHEDKKDLIYRMVSNNSLANSGITISPDMAIQYAWCQGNRIFIQYQGQWYYWQASTGTWVPNYPPFGSGYACIYGWFNL